MPLRQPLYWVVLALTLIIWPPARGQEGSADIFEEVPPSLPGIGNHDPRVRIDPSKSPWRALGKLQATAGSLRISCTGSLVGPRIVLTAAHCLFNQRTRHYFLASSLHFLIGYESGRYAAHAHVLSFVVGSGYEPREAAKTAGSDWAFLTLDSRLGTPDRVLAIAGRLPEIGSKVMIGGYSQDNPLRLTADVDCRIVGWAVDGNRRPLLRHDCAATRGASGAPVLMRSGSDWTIEGVDIAAARSGAGGVAAIPDIRCAPQPSCFGSARSSCIGCFAVNRLADILAETSAVESPWW